MGATDQVEFRTAVERRRSRRRADARRDARGGQEAARAGAPPATAIVMGLGTTGLGVARSLHARGIPVIGLDSARTPASRSRTLRFMTRPGFGDDATALAFFIGLAGRLGGRPVLCPVSEREVSFVARHQAELREHYRFLVADAGTIERAVSKQGHIEWAEQLDLPAPRTHAVIDADGVEMAAASLRFPVVMKPDDPAAWRDGRLAGTGFEKAKAIPAEDADELRRAYARVSAAGPAVVIQEMVVGDDPSHFSYHVLIDGDGVTRAEFVGRKHRLAPPHFGVGTYVESVQDEEILAAGREVARRIGYRGVANIQFKKDARTGRAMLIELNPRFSLWVGLGVDCGVDLPYLYWRTCVGDPLEAPRGWVVGRAWQHLLWDVRTMRTYAREGSVSWLQFARSMMRPRVGAQFSAGDPLPGLVAGWRAVSKAWRRGPGAS